MQRPELLKEMPFSQMTLPLNATTYVMIRSVAILHQIKMIHYLLCIISNLLVTKTNSRINKTGCTSKFIPRSDKKFTYSLTATHGTKTHSRHN